MAEVSSNFRTPPSGDPMAQTQAQKQRHGDDQFDNSKTSTKLSLELSNI